MFSTTRLQDETCDELALEHGSIAVTAPRRENGPIFARFVVGDPEHPDYGRERRLQVNSNGMIAP